jgi:hypothetical protein
MQPTETSERGAGTEPATRYYKSDREPLPLIYMQKPRMWRCYAPGGQLLEYQAGTIPEDVMAHLEEIDEAEVTRWRHMEVREVVGPDGAVTVRDAAQDDAAREVFKSRRWREVMFSPIGPLLLLLVAFVAWGAAASAGASNAQRGSALVPEAIIGVVFIIALGFALIRGVLRSYSLTVDATSVTVFRRRVRLSILGGVAKAEDQSQPLQGLSGVPAIIGLAQFDRVRSAERSRADRLFGRQTLCSTEQQRILFRRRLFSHADQRRILILLGLGSV